MPPESVIKIMKQKLSRGQREERMKEFHLKIMSIIDKDNVSALDAIVHYCEEIGCEVGDIVPLISPSLKQTLFLDGVKNNVIKDEELHLPL